MNNNKQSSVELFAIALYEKGFLQGNGPTPGTTGNEIDDLLEKAKAMEKEQMVDFAYKCINVMAADEFAITHWYDKTFNNKEK